MSHPGHVIAFDLHEPFYSDNAQKLTLGPAEQTW